MPKISNQKIGKVFYTTPRDGYKKGNIWIKRQEESELFDTLDNIGVSICLDGPTGTGKSSLAITTLKRKKLKFIQIQITRNMTWKNFCEKLLNAKTINNSSIDFSFDAGVDRGLPVFKVNFGIKENSSSKEQLEYENLIINKMSEDDICRILYERETSLLIDDFEKAQEEIVVRITDMCKLLTQTYVSHFARLIIVGTEDIYRRLINADISLQERLKEISLGTLSDSNQSWDFLKRGLDKLGITHPSLEYKKGYKSVSLEDVISCKIAFYDAANGLLKSINSLGALIAKNSTVNHRVSKATILKVSKKFLQENVKKHTMEYPLLVGRVSKNEYCRKILIHLFQTGIGKIHHWEEIANSFEEDYDEDQIENAIADLVSIDFLIRTGFDGEILFLKNPTLGHTIGTIISNPKEYGIPKALKVRQKGQMELPFLNKDNMISTNINHDHTP